MSPTSVVLFFFTHPPPPDSYPLSLHDALPISEREQRVERQSPAQHTVRVVHAGAEQRRRRHGHHGPKAGCAMEREQRRSEEHTSELRHLGISYAVFCLKKKNKKQKNTHEQENR